MKARAIKTNNDAEFLKYKIELRQNNIKNGDVILECFGGNGVLWADLKEEYNLKILSIDVKDYSKVNLKGDSLKWLKTIDLNDFSINYVLMDFDFDIIIDDDDVFDLWFSQTIEVNSEYRDTGKFYSKTGTHFVDGVYTSLFSHDSFFGSGCDERTDKEYSDIGYSKRGLFKEITKSSIDNAAGLYNYEDLVKCCLCGGAKQGIQGYEKCKCEELFKDNFWYSRNNFTIGDAAKKLELFCAKKGIDINTLTPETRKEIGTTLALSFAVRKFKRKQSGAKKCK